jgi:iron complex outermembrane receptor protein
LRRYRLQLVHRLTRLRGDRKRKEPVYPYFISERWIGSLVLLFLLAGFSNSEQPVDVVGYVVDSQTKQPVEEVAVRLSGTPRGTSTDDNGQFMFTLSTGSHVLSFSRIGYRGLSREVSISGEVVSALRVELEPRVLLLQGIDVLSHSPDTRFEEFQESLGILSGKDLEKNYSLTLAEMIRNEVGVGIRSMGPAPARPVIRGLSGDRVQITQAGLQSRDLSGTSADHAMTLEMFNLEQIEIIRGPGSLLYGSSANGGVINVVKNKFPRTLPTQAWGTIDLRGSTVNRGGLLAMSIVAPLGPLGVSGETTYRDTRNQQTPIGELDNTEINTNTLIAGVSYAGERGYVGASFDQFNTDYGIPGGFIGGHPNGADIDILRRVFDANASYKFEGESLDRLEASFARTHYHHFEFESNGNIGAEFLFHDYRGDLSLHVGPGDGRSKTILGASLSHYELELGAFVFTPPTSQLSGTLSAYHEASRERFELQVAGRYAFSFLNPRDSERAREGSGDLDRNFHAWSAAVSPLVSISDRLAAGFSVSRSERIPTIEELYNEGPHLAAYTFEVGDATLRSERSFGLEAFLHYRNQGIDVLATGFWSEYANFLTPRNTGDINFALLLPIYAIDGVDARFLGSEFRLATRPADRLLAEIGVSYIHAENRDDDLPLPGIPPLKVNGTLEYRHPWLTVGANAEVAAQQDRVDRFEMPTAAFAVFGLYAQKELSSDQIRHSWTLTLDNMANTEYRNHLSRIRSVMPESGRNLRLNYRISYF